MWLNWVKDMAELGYADGWTRLRRRLYSLTQTAVLAYADGWTR